MKIIFLLIILFFIGALGSYTIGFLECASVASMMKREFDYSFISGCFIKTEKGFIPLETFRSIDVQ